MLAIVFREQKANDRDCVRNKSFDTSLQRNTCEKYGSCLRLKKEEKMSSAFWRCGCIKNIIFFFKCYSPGKREKVYISRSPSETNGSRLFSLTTLRSSLVSICFSKLSMIWLQHCSRAFPNPSQVPGFRVSTRNWLSLWAHLPPGRFPLFRKWGNTCSFLIALSGSPR